MRLLLKGSLFIFFLAFTAIVYAQSISDIDFKTINVDNLSDAQIQQIYKEIQSRGMSISQAIQLAQARGLPQSEASKLSRRLSQVGSQSSTSSQKGSITDGRLRMSQNDTVQSNFFNHFIGADSLANYPQNYQSFDYLKYQALRDSVELVKTKLKNKIYGFGLFTNKSTTFEPSLNIPTPINYQLGPGDELIIDIWGAAQNTYRLTVSPDGMIIINNLGPIYVNGMTIEQARNRLKDRLGEIYSGLNPKNEQDKNTYMQVSLGQVRSIKVTVLGEAAKPGTYTLPSLATVFNALYTAGGPTTKGSFRKIDIIRGDSIITSFDIYDLLVSGDQSRNIRLKDQDIIKINPYANRVEIEGEVKRPAIYEMLDSETLKDLLAYAGNFTGDAYTGRIKIIGNTNREKRINDVSKASFDNFSIKNGDLVEVGKILSRFKNRVQIKGAVFRPGAFELTDSSSVYSLIQRADGLKGDAFMSRGIIYRTREDYTIEAISFDVRKLIQDTEANDIKLVKDDIVQISSIFDLQEDYYVNIVGPVQSPKKYKFVYGMTLEDLIFQAGGFKQSAAPYRIEIARRINDISENDQPDAQIAHIYKFKVDENLQLGGKDASFVLHPFDKVYVRALPNYEEQQEVSIVGEVTYPGTYTITEKNERISDLIQRAGGLTSEAYIQGATLFREREFTEQSAQKTLANVEGLTQQQQQKQLSSQLLNRKNAQVGINLPKVIENPSSKYDLFLEKGDSLFIPKQLQTITVKGGVFYPTTIRYESGKKYKDYITAAGGFTDMAKKRRAYIIYANGDVDRVKSFLFFKDFPSVRPGATIVVPEKAETRKLTPQERVSILSAIISTAALVTTTIIQITR